MNAKLKATSGDSLLHPALELPRKRYSCVCAREGPVLSSNAATAAANKIHL